MTKTEKKWYWEDNPPTHIITYVIQTALVAALIAIGSNIITESIKSPDFNICVNGNQSVRFIIQENSSVTDLSDYLYIKANNLHSKRYLYPIYLNYTFESAKNFSGIKLDFIPREIRVDNDLMSFSTVMISIDTRNVVEGSYNIKINGRGGGGVLLGNDNVDIPQHFCWITIEIKRNSKSEKPKLIVLPNDFINKLNLKT